MDWFNQLRIKNTLILLLVMMNLITVSVLWIQADTEESGEKKKRIRQSQVSSDLMKAELGLSEEQTEKIRTLLLEYHAQTKPVNEQITERKIRLAESVFSSNADAASAQHIAEQIGDLQKELEVLRYRHFVNVAAQCDSVQKEKLRPVIVQLFGRKPPKENSFSHLEESNVRQEQKDQRSLRIQRENGPIVQRGSRDSETSQPISEKLQKYSDRLNLSAEQRKKLEIILTASQKRGGRLRGQVREDGRSFESEKERIRKDEDDRIIDILTDAQKMEFRKMIEKRRR